MKNGRGVIIIIIIIIGSNGNNNYDNSLGSSNSNSNNDNNSNSNNNHHCNNQNIIFTSFPVSHHFNFTITEWKYQTLFTAIQFAFFFLLKFKINFFFLKFIISEYFIQFQLISMTNSSILFRSYS